MRNGYVSSRASYASYGRNQNTVRHSTDSLGSVTMVVLTALVVALLALIYVTQGAKATGYDYEISKVDSEIAELQAQKEDLTVERARLTSVANSETSAVAASMETTTVSGYVEE